MDKKAQVGFGLIVMIAVSVLVGLAFWGLMGDNVGTLTKTFTSVNQTMTMPSGVIAEMPMCGQKAISVVILNATDNKTIGATNYTISQGIGTDGYLAAKILNVTGADANFSGKQIRVTCTYEPKGYITDGGGRAVVSLVAVMMAILIMVSAIPDLRNGVLNFFKGS